MFGMNSTDTLGAIFIIGMALCCVVVTIAGVVKAKYTSQYEDSNQLRTLKRIRNLLKRQNAILEEIRGAVVKPEPEVAPPTDSETPSESDPNLPK